MDIERELKLIGGDGFAVEDLLAALEPAATLSQPNRRTVRDIYMDTRSRSLARKSAAVR